MFWRVLAFFLILTGLPGKYAVATDTNTTRGPETNTTASTTTTIMTTTENHTTTVGPNTTVMPIPTVPVYFVKNGSSICLLAQMNLKFLIPYYNHKGDMVTRDFYLNSTSIGSVVTSGNCTNSTQSLQLDWFPNNQQPAWRLLFSFHRVEPYTDPGHFSFDALHFNYSLNSTLFPDTNNTRYTFVSKTASQFTCPIGSYFQCIAKQTLQLTNSSMGPAPPRQQDVYITITNMKIEAFRSAAEPFFVGSLRECSADYMPNKVVPIVVGVALAVLIVIALLTFIIGNRRRQIGYQEI
ncbi:unnamed protein product [Calicophoron daubneyi]|uniref:Lysosome-associated membrane glycoprotein 5 n=1 Tax=Calicophoron daubneyi TaxID=300641 RepID=A0AAV2TN49_CALDB